MDATTKRTRFARYAWLVLWYNLAVILWGVFLRASKSGDGCGQHWFTCHGEIIPTAPELKTVIEFVHRASTGPAFLAVIVLLVWAFLRFEKGSIVRKAAVGSFLFILSEVIIGGVLVLTGNTAESLTAERPFLAIGHLINSFLLLAFLALTGWFAASGRRLALDVGTKYLVLLAVGVLGILLVGSSGSVAALSSMLFPSETLGEGLGKDFSAASNILLRMRVSHPILSILTSVYLVFLAGWLKSAAEHDRNVAKWSNALTILVLIQVAFGAATLLMLAPIVMQVGHLLLADLLWISFVLLGASFLSRPPTEYPK